MSVPGVLYNLNDKNVYSDNISPINQVAIQFLDSIEGTPYDFKVRLNRTIRPTMFVLNHFQVPNVVYNQASPYTIEELGQPDVTFSMPRQIYTFSNIAAALQTALNAASPSGATYTVTTNPVTLKVSITSTVPWRFKNVTFANSSYFQIGYNNKNPLDPLTLQLTHISPGTVSLPAVSSYIQVNIDNIGYPGSGCRPGARFTFIVPVSNISVQIGTYNNAERFVQAVYLQQGEVISTLHITLLDERGNLLGGGINDTGGNTFLTLGYLDSNGK